MKTFCTHTLVRQGMPFIEPVLRQVIPFANRCLITISTKSDDGTYQVIEKLQSEFPDKIFIKIENVVSVGELTKERQKQVDNTIEDWILFLDDDDFWPTDSLKEVMIHFDDDCDALTNNPYQVIDKEHYDISWHNKWFTKWFKNQKGVHYRYNWPEDMIFLNDQMLYWKVNPRVVKNPSRYFHLSYIKNHSFRKEDWAKRFAFHTPIPENYPEQERETLEKIFAISK